MQQDALIINKLGLHARASAKLTQLASSFKCEVMLSCPVVILTAFPDDRPSDAAAAIGGTWVLGKPKPLEAIKAVATAALGRARAALG